MRDTARGIAEAIIFNAEQYDNGLIAYELFDGIAKRAWANARLAGDAVAKETQKIVNDYCRN